MAPKRTNKYPNNRYTNNNVKRFKKISPHVTKNKADKLNRNGPVKKTIPARTEYTLQAPLLPKKVKKNNFFLNVFTKDGYYYYLWIPFVLLLLTIVIDFSLQMVVYTNFNPYYVSLAKNTMFFMLFSTILLGVSLGSFIYIGLQTAKHNLSFSKAMITSLKIILFIFILEVALTIVSYFSFLVPYMSLMLPSSVIKAQYLLYLTSWVFIKSIIYLFLVSVSYLIFFKLKFV